LATNHGLLGSAGGARFLDRFSLAGAASAKSAAAGAVFVDATLERGWYLTEANDTELGGSPLNATSTSPWQVAAHGHSLQTRSPAQQSCWALLNG
jgi:hypothetical protein